MLDDSRERHRELFGELTDRRGAVSEPLDDRSSGRVGQGAEDAVELVARALQRSAGECEHLAALASRPCALTGDTIVTALVLEALHDWIDAPAYVITTTWDVRS